MPRFNNDPGKLGHYPSHESATAQTRLLELVLMCTKKFIAQKQT